MHLGAKLHLRYFYTVSCKKDNTQIKKIIYKTNNFYEEKLLGTNNDKKMSFPVLGDYLPIHGSFYFFFGSMIFNILVVHT
jgi:hypothetical protein